VAVGIDAAAVRLTLDRRVVEEHPLVLPVAGGAVVVPGEYQLGGGVGPVHQVAVGVEGSAVRHANGSS